MSSGRANAADGIWVVIPAYNESEVIRLVVEGLLERGYTTVVVDDGSTVPLDDVLAGLGTHLLRHAINLGQGGALQTGISYALARGARVIVTFDGDGQHQPDDIPALVAPILSGEQDVTLGSRFLKGGSAVQIPVSKRRVLKLAVVFTRWTTGLDVTDTHNGIRALGRKAAAALRITQNGMAHASQILHQIAAQRLRYAEVPVTIVYSDYVVRKGQRLSNAFNILWESFSANFYR